MPYAFHTVCIRFAAFYALEASFAQAGVARGVAFTKKPTQRRQTIDEFSTRQA